MWRPWVQQVPAAAVWVQPGPWDQCITGKAFSDVGLTVYVVKDPERGRLVLQTSALFLTVTYAVLILKKMNQSTQPVLLKVREQLTLLTKKPGIICQLKA